MEQEQVRVAAEAIGREILEVHERSYGLGAGAVNVFIHENDVFVILDELELSPAEKTLIDAGRDDAVLDNRQTFQKAIESTFVAIVERATGRTVAAFLSRVNLDPHFAIEVFRLAPA